MAGVSTQKTKLFRSADGGTTFTEIANLASVSLPDGQSPELDASDLSSTAKEYVAGLADNGSVNFSVNFDGAQATHQQLVADRAAGTGLTWKIAVPETGGVNYTTAVFAGFVQQFSGDNSVDQVQSWSGALRVNGAVTFAHGASL